MPSTEPGNTGSPIPNTSRRAEQHQPDCIVIARMADGRFTEMNAAMLRLFGRTRDEFYTNPTDG